ncbi:MULTISPECIES: hypothetical protein [Mycobacterium]|uniref:hypothetical protein n=1 Tax=Mycobacterium TaxID=1763 RepID=UPI0013D78E23|nr:MULTISPECIES: hypothetical protein [Mycobacterium]MDV3135839.1 hypothetical protein [Mycobacterium sp. 29Ha]
MAVGVAGVAGEWTRAGTLSGPIGGDGGGGGGAHSVAGGAAAAAADTGGRNHR